MTIVAAARPLGRLSPREGAPTARLMCKMQNALEMSGMDARVVDHVRFSRAMCWEPRALPGRGDRFVSSETGIP